MPIYQYNCQSCGHELEVLQKVSEAPLTDCPQCGAAALKKGITAAAFRLKGTGWYETDFKNKHKPKDADQAKQKGTAGADAKTAKDSGAKSEDQSAAKSKTGSTTASEG